MREIKFRVWAWDYHPKRMIYFNNSEMWDTNWLDEKTIMQFTGLLDRNSKEIYEGDIMKTDLFTKTFQITFGNSEKWGASFCHQSHNSIYFLNKNFTDTSEVIGNIYENPELLT